MSKSFRIIITATLLIVFFSSQTRAQSKKGKSIDASIGYGISIPYENINISGSGFYVQGEYVFSLSKWFSVRPYAGVILTSTDKSTDEDIQSEYKVTSKAFLFGGKLRVTAPIPWVSPYIEAGIGASLGSFETITPNTSIKDGGFLIHIPVTIGLAIGRKNNFDFAFTYYYHPSAEQFAGAVALGYSFPLN